MKKKFLEFLIEGETPPKELAVLTQKDILLSFRGKVIIQKFLGLQVIGAMVSLLFCPQFSVGLVDNHGIIHILRVVGDLACACFCGTLFLSSGIVLAILGMKGEELWWLWRRYKFFLNLVPAALWAVLMLVNKLMQLPGEELSYHLTWIAAAMGAQATWLVLRKIVAQRSLLKQLSV